MRDDLARQEPPFGLAMKSSDELRQHIENMRLHKTSDGENEAS